MCRYPFSAIVETRSESLDGVYRVYSSVDPPVEPARSFYWPVRRSYIRTEDRSHPPGEIFERCYRDVVQFRNGRSIKY